MTIGSLKKGIFAGLPLRHFKMRFKNYFSSLKFLLQNKVRCIHFVIRQRKADCFVPVGDMHFQKNQSGFFLPATLVSTHFCVVSLRLPSYFLHTFQKVKCRLQGNPIQGLLPQPSSQKEKWVINLGRILRDRAASQSQLSSAGQPPIVCSSLQSDGEAVSIIPKLAATLAFSLVNGT